MRSEKNTRHVSTRKPKLPGSLSHPNIVTIFDVGRSGDIAYIAMEFLQGSSCATF